jgi:hypothetical protein
LLDIELLAGQVGRNTTLRAPEALNACPLRVPIVARRDPQRTLSFTRRNVLIPAGILRADTNRLVVEPRFESARDYLWLGTVAVHFKVGFAPGAAYEATRRCLSRGVGPSRWA